MVIDHTGDYFGDYNTLDPDVDIATVDENEDHFVPSYPGGDSDNSGSCSDEGDDDTTDDEEGWELPVDITDAGLSRSPSPELLFPDGFLEEPAKLPPACPPLPTQHHDIQEPFIESYPDSRAGAPLLSQTSFTSDHQRYEQGIGRKTNIWAPFQSEIDWRIAKWAKMRGPSSTSFTELLAIDGVCEKLGLSYRNVNELNKIIDEHLPSSRPQFKRQEVIVQGRVVEVYFRDILQCVKALYGDAEFAPYLKFSPERHFKDGTKQERLYHDMHTGDWWWSIQTALDRNAGPGRTAIPIIISSDKTQVTVFRNKSAYPVYLTIGNIPKELRRKPSKRAYILLGYLPATNLEHIKNTASRRRSVTNLFHTCMRHIVKPLEVPGSTGVIMTSGDGVERLGHPIFAAFVGDYPEQILVTCSISGYCPCCTIPRQRIGENTEPHPLRHLRSILEALQMVDEGAAAFVKACKDVGIKPVFEPFWANLPYSNIFLAITPDLLHQLYQGVFKHMKAWVLEVYGTHEIDARCRRLPPNHNIRLFMKGIASLSRLSGQEHDQISRFILGLICDTPLPNGMSGVRLVRCLRGLLDFLFLAQYPVVLHLGTFDNFNTEYTERLHIDMAKDAYRSTNKKDEYPQMMKWLERKEKIAKHESYLSWIRSGEHPPLRAHWIPPGLNTARTLKLTKHPSVYAVKIPEGSSLCRFLVQLKNPHLSGRRLEDAVDSLFLGISHVSTYHRVKFLQYDELTNVFSTADSIHVQPSRRDKHGKDVNGRFDTALVRINDSEGPMQVIQDTRVAQVRLVFTVPEKSADYLFEGIPVKDKPRHLAYVEWFSPFSTQPDENCGLYKVSRCNVEGGRLASVVDVRRLVCSIHLFPRFGRIANRDWTSSTVLDQCPSFFTNLHSDRHIYQLFVA
ncbi:hypothetical protein K435DRAFT_820522 [Dendrothele bispora CBS 962.96]|uniref:Uncharacterized protein n=1 Tax=Dendrothele bispora (strain CBS 962.96) TaxID=1314807 RepID=A0A4S8LS36_DENBC|nr:hypothetical protein K435DRAFT_820522 [Dendrothele bispora CBS 962.96]